MISQNKLQELILTLINDSSDGYVYLDAWYQQNREIILQLLEELQSRREAEEEFRKISDGFFGVDYTFVTK
jgi:hypothetical protein